MKGYNPNRDAYQAINGFVYQVDLSIYDWINLKDGEFLLLEHLEDIDIIREHCDTNGNINQELTVKQVKHLENVTLTLRKNEIKEAIYNFEEHKRNHSTIKMRLLSNAKIGKEDSTDFKLNTNKNRVGGLIIWQEIYKGNEKEVVELDKTVTKIRSILFDTPPDKKMKNRKSKREWIDFQHKISEKTNSEFIEDIIKKIEIGHEQVASKNAKSELISKLNNKILTNSNDEAEMLYNKLFAKIFHLISIKDTTKDSHRELFTTQRLAEIAKNNSAKIMEIGNLNIREKLDEFLNQIETRLNQSEKNITEKIDEISNFLKASNEELNKNRTIFDNEIERLLNKYKITPEAITETEIIKGLCSNNIMLKKYSSFFVFLNNLSEKYKHLIIDNLKTYETDENLVILSLQALSVAENVEFELIEKYANSENKKIKDFAFKTLFAFRTQLINQDNIETWIYWLENEKSKDVRVNISSFLNEMSDEEAFNPIGLLDRFSLILRTENEALVIENVLAIISEIHDITKKIELTKYLSFEYNDFIRYQCLEAFYFDGNFEVVTDYIEKSFEQSDNFRTLFDIYFLCKYSENSQLLHWADRIASEFSFSQLIINASKEKPKRVKYKKNAIDVRKKNNELLSKSVLFNEVIDTGARRNECLMLLYNENSSISKNVLINYLVYKGYLKIDLTTVLHTEMSNYEKVIKSKDKLLILLSNNINDKIRIFISKSVYPVGIVTFSNISDEKKVSMKDKDYIIIIDKKDFEKDLDFKRLINKHTIWEFNDEFIEKRKV